MREGQGGGGRAREGRGAIEKQEREKVPKTKTPAIILHIII